MNDERLIAITRGDSKLIKELLSIFISQNTQDLGVLEVKMGENDGQKSHYFVHKIKSSFKTFGFIKCFTAFNDIEIRFEQSVSLDELKPAITENIANCRSKLKEAEQYLEKLD